MATADLAWLLLPRQLRELSADLAVVIAYPLFVCLVVFSPLGDETWLRVVVGLPLVLFLPGYAFIAALFPEASDSSEDDSADQFTRRGITLVERLALSLGFTFVIVPLVGFALNYTPWGIRQGPVVITLSGMTFACGVVAARRRLQLSESDRFQIPYRTWMATTRHWFYEPESRSDAVLNVVLVGMIILATASVGYAVSTPRHGPPSTNLYLLTERGGQQLATDYPSTLTVGESEPLVVGIENHERQPMNYTVVVVLQRIRGENESTTVVESQELDRFRAQVQANETWQNTYEVTPPISGDQLRLAFLLYRESPPASPRIENAYREIHLRVNVSA